VGTGEEFVIPGFHASSDHLLSVFDDNAKKQDNRHGGSAYEVIKNNRQDRRITMH